jgi:hypothetical protein
MNKRINALSQTCFCAWKALRGFVARPAMKRRFIRLALKKEHKHRLAVFLVFGIVFLVVMVVFFDAISSHVQNVSQVSALAERVEFEVTQPRLAAIPVRQMRIATSDPALDGKCINGLIIPVLKANVIYGRVGYGPLSIQIVPPDADQQNVIAGEFEPSDNGRALSLKGSTYLEVDASCARNTAQEQSSANPTASIPLPLPIWGKAKIGSEFKGIKSSDPDPTLLLSGQIKVSARAVEFLPWLLDLRATLYPVTALDLPVGSRLETYIPPQRKSPPDSEFDKDRAEFLSNWWGTAYVDSEKPALNVELATDTPKLALYRPNRHEPDIIEASRMNQVFEDPNLVKLYKLFGVFALAAAFSGWLLGAFERPPDAPNRETDRK